MTLFYKVFVGLALVLSLVGCAIQEISKQEATPQENEILNPVVFEKRYGALHTLGAPLPLDYKTWPAQSRFVVDINNKEKIFLEMYGTLLDKETIKVISLVETQYPKGLARQLLYFTDTEASIRDVYYHPTFLHANISKNTTPDWKIFDYSKTYKIMNSALQKTFDLTTIQMAEIQILFMVGNFQAMLETLISFQEKDAATSHEQDSKKEF